MQFEESFAHILTVFSENSLLQIQLTDFPKGSHNDCLTLLSLNTDIPQIFHGSGNNSEASQDQAAMNALKALTELGLDNLSKKQSP